MALVIGRYEGLFTLRSLRASSGKQTFISPYNKGHKLFIIPKLHTQQQNILLN